ncbi:MAG: mRNA surveillance protein pelota [Candidatus Hadarchaeota archaeon]
MYKDLERNRIKLKTQNLNDLWHLQHLISEGDVVTAHTWRRPETDTSDKIRPERMEKERVKLSLRIKETEFQEFSDNLRVLGVIEKGPDVGDHHSIDIGTDKEFTLTKRWEEEHLERLEEARRASQRPKVVLVAMDDEKATFGLVRQFGLKKLGEVASGVSGKMYESDREAAEKDYYNKIRFTVERFVENEDASAVIIAGPGMAKKKVLSRLQDENPDIAGMTHLGATSHTGRSGLNEIINRGIVRRVSEEDRTSKESGAVGELMKRLGQGGKATYGVDEVEEAAEMGAVEMLLVSDEKLKEDREGIRSIMETVRERSGEVLVVSSEHDAGNQLARLSGVGALLRYRTG